MERLSDGGSEFQLTRSKIVKLWDQQGDV